MKCKIDRYHRRLSEWKDVEQNMKRNVIEYLLEAVEKYPDKTAFRDEKKKITFNELYKSALCIATSIINILGPVKNRPIAVYMDKSVECIEVLMGIAYSGNFYTPIDMKTPYERFEKIIEVLEPEIIILKNSTENLKSSITELFYDKILEVGSISEKQVCENYSRVIDADPLYVLFTSGSTGIPKGVTISHRGVIDYAEWLKEQFEFDLDTVFGNQAPFYFDNSILDIYSTIKNMSTMVIIPERLFAFSGELLNFIKENSINTLFWVPSALISVANTGVLENTNLNVIEKVLFCGEVMPNKQLNMWRRACPNALFANLYGPTEITDVCTYYIVDRVFADDEPLPIGIACKNTEVFILNESNEIAGEEEVGELCVRGTCLSMGYYGNFKKTGTAFVQNPLNSKYQDIMYRTGDLVKYNSKGEILYICRKDDQIKHQGHRIELGEIEVAALSIKGMKQCCAIYHSEEKMILLCCACEQVLDKKEIFKQLKLKIPKYMLPAKIEILEELPLNINGKIDRVKLKAYISAT